MRHRLLLVLVSLMAALGIAEALVRILDVPPAPLAPLPVTSYRLSDDPILRYEYVPGYKATDKPFDARQKGFAINSQGFRDYEYPVAKPKQTIRILALGDSTTVGSGVPDMKDTYPKVLERLLNGRARGVRFEVLNMGVAGYDTLKEVELLRVRGLKYGPDLALIVFCINDFDSNCDGGIYEALLKKNPLKVSATGIRSSLFWFLLRHSRLAFVMYHRLNALFPSLASSKENVREYSERFLKGKSSPEAGLILLDRLQRSAGFKAAVAVLPVFHPSYRQDRYRAISSDLAKIARRFPNIRLIELKTDIENSGHDIAALSWDRLHPNEIGHLVIGRILYEKITGDKIKAPL